MAGVEPPLHPLFGHPKHFEKLVASVVARIPVGSVLLVARSSPTTWMDATLAGAVAARINGSVHAVGLSGDASAAATEAATFQSTSASSSSLPATRSGLDSGTTSAFLCCAWVHAEVAPHLDALVRTYSQGPAQASVGASSTSARSRASSTSNLRAVQIVGLVSVRFEQSPATAFLEALGPVIACSFSRDGGPPWQPSQPSLALSIPNIPDHFPLAASTPAPAGDNVAATYAVGSGSRKRPRVPSPSEPLAEPAADLAADTSSGPIRSGPVENVEASSSDPKLSPGEPEAFDDALRRDFMDALEEKVAAAMVPAAEVALASGSAINTPDLDYTIDLTESTDSTEGSIKAPTVCDAEQISETLRSSGSNSRDSNNTGSNDTSSSSSSSSNHSNNLNVFSGRSKLSTPTSTSNDESRTVAAGGREQQCSSPLGMCSFGYGANAPSEDRSSSLRVPGLRCCPPDGPLEDATDSNGYSSSNLFDASGDGTATAHLYLVADGHGGGLAAQFVNDHLLLEAVQQLRLLPAYDDSATAAAAAAAANTSSMASEHDSKSLPDATDPTEMPATESAAEMPGRLQKAVQAALMKAFASTEAAFLASLDATWACHEWQAADDRDQEQKGMRPRSPLLPAPLPESILPGATSSSSIPKSASGVAGEAVVMDCSNSATAATAVVGNNSSVAGTTAAGSTSTSSSSSDSNSYSCSRSNTNTSHGLAAGLCNAGSCAVLVCVLGGWLYTAHVGDCRVVLASLVPDDDTANEVGTSSPVAPTLAGGATAGTAEAAPPESLPVGTAEAAPTADESTAAPVVATNEAAIASTTSSAGATPRRQRSSSIGSSSSAGGGSKGRAAKRSRRSSSLSAAASLPPLMVDALTSDQNCYRKDEVDRVTELASSDLEPIRPSKNDQKALDTRAKNLAQRQLAKDRAAQSLSGGGTAAAEVGAEVGAAPAAGKGTKGKGNSKGSGSGVVAKGRGGKGSGKGKGSAPLLRVAGSLAVTRAIGDMYLKHRRYAPDDLRPHVPYLIAEPETSCRRLNSDLDTMLVLASDGLWEVATPEQACGWAATHLANHGLASSTCTPPLSLPTPSGITPSTSASATTIDGAITAPATDADRASHLATVTAPAPENAPLEAQGTQSTGQSSSLLAGQAETTANTTAAAAGIPGASSNPPLSAPDLQTRSAATKRPLRGRSSDRSRRSASNSSSSSNGQVTVAQEVVLQALSACAAKARMSALELSRLPPGPERRKFHDDVTVLIVMLPAAQRLVVAGRATSDD